MQNSLKVVIDSKHRQKAMERCLEQCIKGQDDDLIDIDLSQAPTIEGHTLSKIEDALNKKYN